ncbi:MAG: hypothetical protein KDL87_16790, partial [Verrucomicrobiae bacterium]|nr:hypothetical protein [Verrucomicrobiae bacterium]
MEIAFALLRDARETQDWERWRSFRDLLAPLVADDGDYRDRYFHEKVLQKLSELDRTAAQELLQAWSPSSGDLVAGLRKAGCLAEVGQYLEAEKLTKEVLDAIRRAIANSGQDIHLLSLEGWCMFSLSLVEQALSPRFGPLRSEYQERWRDLRPFDCDPWQHWDATRLEITNKSSPNDEGQRVDYVEYGFDPGSTTSRKMYHFGFEDGVLPSFAFLRLFETVGISFYYPGVDIGSDVIEKACQRIAPYVSYWTPSILLRCGQHKAISSSEGLSRFAVARLPDSIVDHLHHWLGKMLDDGITAPKDSAGTSSEKQMMLSMIEILSRLSIRLDEDGLNQDFSRALGVFENLPVEEDEDLCGALLRWFRRLFFAADIGTLVTWLPPLMNSRLPKLAGISWANHEIRRVEPAAEFPVGAGSIGLEEVRGQ